MVAGFTLTELLVVVAMIAILRAVPSARPGRSSMQLRLPSARDMLFVL
jgi:prepilin-type N-terminal cleavage/methylation domain-containing protein